MKLLRWFSIAGLLMTTGAFAETNTQPLPKPQKNYIKAHLSYLADDLLEGRDTGTKGHELAALYIANEMAKYGLKPAGHGQAEQKSELPAPADYMQRVSFRRAYLEQQSPKLIMDTPDGEMSLDYPKDYITGPDVLRLDSSLKGEMVFAGYGIVADELSHNDYDQLDVSGKVVVVLAGKPKSFPSEEGAHLASRYQKAHYAAERGAIGLITLSTPTSEKVRPYQRSLNYLHTPSLRWLNSEGRPANVFPELQGSAFFSQHAAEALFNYAPTSLADIYAILEEDGVPRGFSLPVSINLSKNSTHEVITSPNVAGIIEGSDPQLKDEVIIFTAHSDHIGKAKTVKQDKINNGAMDNASGTSILLETARVFSEMPIKPKRSVMFLSVTGEEKGLLGADYFAHNPTVPIGNIVANINLDMPLLMYDFADVIAFGANHSDLKASVANATSQVGVSLSPDPWPEQALFTRSDHYAFVKQGVPSIFLVTGLKSTDPNEDSSKVFGTFLATHYHKPTDDLNLPFHWGAAVKFAAVNAQIGHTLANQAARPQWNADSFFGQTFAR